jgi:hypothetical protein
MKIYRDIFRFAFFAVFKLKFVDLSTDLDLISSELKIITEYY